MTESKNIFKMALESLAIGLSHQALDTAAQRLAYRGNGDA
jgi:hypothetical protein